MFVLRAHQMMLSGWKRSSPESNHLLGPRTDIELICIQSPTSPSLRALRPGLRARTFLASSLNPISAKWSLQTHSQMIFPSHVTSMMVSSKRGLSLIWWFLRFLWQRKLWWMIPIVVVLLLFGFLIFFTQSSAVAPFIYTLFWIFKPQRTQRPQRRKFKF